MSVPPRTQGALRTRARWSLAARRLALPAQTYIHTEETGGLALLAAAVLALAWANSPWGASYEQFWGAKLGFDAGVGAVAKDLRHWVNDGLMALFFFIVALEIKDELLNGELSDRRRATLPAFAALGGMLFPALIYAGLTFGTPGARGWGIPIATDIAFALGVLALTGRWTPYELRVLLLAFAALDDVGGIVVIALFYTANLSLAALAVGGVLLLLLFVLRAAGVRSLSVYLPLAVAFWFAILQSGVHATLAGVALGALAPARPWLRRRDYAGNARRALAEFEQAEDDRAEALLGEIEELTRRTEAPLGRMKRLLHPWVSFVVLPLFALANAGVELSPQLVRGALSSRVSWGIVAGLLLGKLVGVFGFTWLAVRTGISRLPRNVAWRHIVGISILAGIGFTVSLFIAGLAFDGRAELPEAKTAILLASALAGILGYTWFGLAARFAAPDDEG
ncbi:MAG: Na+/H+ antiporter NhaA [Acidobacteria bacterium]|nr:Na+/H+ antiporter NhaA [Acidobacteriota bacterium]